MHLPLQPARHDFKWRQVSLFILCSLGLAWLVALPMWFSHGLNHPAASILLRAIMWVPGLVALVLVWGTVPRGHRLEFLGLRPLRPIWKLVRYCLLGVILVVAFVFLALVIANALGLYQADFVHLSGLQQLLQSESTEEFNPVLIVVAQASAAIIIGPIINLPLALGEELGWRGWLFPRLLSLGVVPAIVISGIAWGIWHAPLILLGYNYGPDAGWIGIAAMIGTCTVFGGLFGWLRMRSQSVWPAALAHGALNASAGFTVLFHAAGTTTNTLNATFLGWSGWILPAVALAVLLFVFPIRSTNQTRYSPDGTPEG